MPNVTCCVDAVPEPGQELLNSVVQLPAQSVLLPSDAKPASYAENGMMEMLTGAPAGAVPVIFVSDALRAGVTTKAIVTGLGSSILTAAVVVTAAAWTPGVAGLVTRQAATPVHEVSPPKQRSRMLTFAGDSALFLHSPQEQRAPRMQPCASFANDSVNEVAEARLMSTSVAPADDIRVSLVAPVHAAPGRPQVPNARTAFGCTVMAPQVAPARLEGAPASRQRAGTGRQRAAGCWRRQAKPWSPLR